MDAKDAIGEQKQIRWFPIQQPGREVRPSMKRKLLLFLGVLFVMLALKYAFG